MLDAKGFFLQWQFAILNILQIPNTFWGEGNFGKSLSFFERGSNLSGHLEGNETASILDSPSNSRPPNFVIP